MNGNACKAKCEWHDDCNTAGCVTRRYINQRIKQGVQYVDKSKGTRRESERESDCICTRYSDEKTVQSVGCNLIHGWQDRC